MVLYHFLAKICQDLEFFPWVIEFFSWVLSFFSPWVFSKCPISKPVIMKPYPMVWGTKGGKNMFIRLYTYFCEDAKNSNSIHQRVIRLLFMFTIINKVMLPRNVRVSERSMSTHMGRCYTLRYQYPGYQFLRLEETFLN